MGCAKRANFSGQGVHGFYQRGDDVSNIRIGASAPVLESIIAERCREMAKDKGLEGGMREEVTYQL